MTKAQAAQRKRIEREVRAAYPDETDLMIQAITDDWVRDEDYENGDPDPYFPEDTPGLTSCDSGNGEGRFHGRM